MVDMPMPQREYPTIYRISGVFDDAADALKAIRGMQKNDGKSHLAIDILQKWIPAYVEESRKYMLHEFRMNQTAATSKELLNKIHEPYVSPYIARQIAIQIHFDGAQTTVQEYVGANSQVVPSRNVIDIRETDLDPLKEFLEKFNDVERATVQWHPQVRFFFQSPSSDGEKAERLSFTPCDDSMMLLRRASDSVPFLAA